MTIQRPGHPRAPSIQTLQLNEGASGEISSAQTSSRRSSVHSLDSLGHFEREIVSTPGGENESIHTPSHESASPDFYLDNEQETLDSSGHLECEIVSTPAGPDSPNYFAYLRDMNSEDISLDFFESNGGRTPAEFRIMENEDIPDFSSSNLRENEESPAASASIPLPQSQKRRLSSESLEIEQDSLRGNCIEREKNMKALGERSAKKAARMAIANTFHEPNSHFVSAFKANFPKRLQEILTACPIGKPDFTNAQKEAGWEALTEDPKKALGELYLPLQQRVFAAVFETIFKYCEEKNISINESNTDELFKIVLKLGNQQIKINTGKEEETSAELSNFFAKDLITQFKVKETADLFNQLIAPFNEFVDTKYLEMLVRKDQIWRFFVNPVLVNSATNAGVDSCNPFLRYLSNSPEDAQFFQMAKGAEYIVLKLKKGESLTADLLIGIYGAYTNPPLSFMKDKSNGNECYLLMGWNLTKSGFTELETDIADFNNKYFEGLERIGRDLKDVVAPLVLTEKPDPDYGDIPGYKLSRSDVDPDILKEILNNLVAKHTKEDVRITELNSGEEQKKFYPINDLNLAKMLTRWRFFPTANPIVGHLVLNFLRLSRGEELISLLDYDALDGHANNELLAQLKA